MEMEEITKQVSTVSKSPHSMMISTSPNVCVVCSDAARYSYYGAIVCLSCKVFFKRNAQKKSIPLSCHYGDHCEININNRRNCTSCRLGKCFSNRMTADMFRSSRTKQIKNKLILERLSKHEQIRPLNILERDQSMLNVDQWNDLSNLVNCFDEYIGYSLVTHFIDEQTSLPPKFRFKYAPVNDFYLRMMSNIQLIFEKNRHSLSLSSDDRSFLLRNTIDCTANIGGAFILKQFQLLDFPNFFQSSEIIFQPSAIVLIKRLIEQLDQDLIFIKILFGLTSFLISNYTFYNNIPAEYLRDSKKIMDIQDMYTELIWRYLISKHNYRDAVLCFLNFLRCLFLLNDSIVQAHQQKQFTDIIDSVVESTELKLNLNS